MGRSFATDASTDGAGLTRWGHSRAHSLVYESAEGLEGGASDPIVVVELFAGMGGLHQAIELLGLTPMGVIGVDSLPESARIMRQHCRHIIWHKDIKELTRVDVAQWRLLFPRALRVLVAGGWPCVNHSALNTRRQGASAESSRLVEPMMDIRQWLEDVSGELGLPQWDIMELYENVIMDGSDLKTQSRILGCQPMLFEAAQVGHVRRPRLFWLKNIPLIKGTDLTITGPRQVRGQDYAVPTIRVDTIKRSLNNFLNDKCTKLAEPNEPFATFTRPQPRQSPPPDPAGLAQCSSKAIRRWKGDAYRLQPYQYEDRNLVQDPNTGPRRLLPEEQLRLMGFTSSHLTLKTRLTNDMKQQLIGNSFHAVTVARLLAALACTEDEAYNQDLCNLLWTTWEAMEAKAKTESKPWQLRFGSKSEEAQGVVGLRKLLLPPAEVSRLTLILA